MFFSTVGMYCLLTRQHQFGFQLAWADTQHIETTLIPDTNAKCTAIYFIILTAPLILYRRIRILYMPPVYAVISFLSYRFFRDYTYYSFIEVGASLLFSRISVPLLIILPSLWGAKNFWFSRPIITANKPRQSLWVLLCSFIILNVMECSWRGISSLLLIEFVADATKNQSNMFEKKEKRKLMFPVGVARNIGVSLFLLECQVLLLEISTYKGSLTSTSTVKLGLKSFL